MGSEGFSPLSSSRFPEGLRVLVVDHDPKCLKKLEKLLNKCKYEVTTCSLMQETLKLLQERKDEFDIVISEFNMPDMDLFEFLKHVSVQMDIPVIIMSCEEDMSREVNLLKKGACDYLVKPIKFGEVRKIWKHLLRSRMQRTGDTEHPSEIQTAGNELSQPDTDLDKKRKEVENKECGDRPAKKARVVWTSSLHQKFVKVVEQIGLDKAGPKKILEMMNVPWLTREHVASHLQKYRLSVSRKRKEKEPKAASGWIKNPRIAPEFVPGGFHSIDQNVVKTGNLVPGGFHIQDATVCNGNGNAMLSTPTALEANNAPVVIDPPISTPPEIRFNQFSWSATVPPIQLQQQFEPQYDVGGHVTDTHNAIIVCADQSQSHLMFDQIGSGWNTINHQSEQNRYQTSSIWNTTNHYTDQNCYQMSSVWNTANHQSEQTNSIWNTTNHQSEQNHCQTRSIWNTTNHQSDQNLHDNLLNSDVSSCPGDSYAHYQEPVNFEPFNNVENHVTDTADPPHQLLEG